MRTLLSSAIIIVLMFLVTTNVHARNRLFEESELSSMGYTGYESINPNSLAYPLKRIGEKIYPIFLSDEKEQDYLKIIYDRRFRELVYIINTEKTGFFEETVNRHNTTLNGVNKNEDIVGLQNDLKTNVSILEIFRDRYPANSTYWMLVQHAIDSTNKLII